MAETRADSQHRAISLATLVSFWKNDYKNPEPCYIFANLSENRMLSEVRGKTEMVGTNVSLTRFTPEKTQ